MGETHAPEDCQEAGEPAPPTASPREGRRRPHMPSFGGGPGARARPGLRAEGHAARAGHAGGTAARPLSLSRDDARTTHTLGPRGRGRGRRPPRAPAPLRPPRRGARGGAPPRRRRGRLSLFPGGLTPLETARDDDRAAGAPSPPAGPLPPGGPADGERAPPPAPEADATETRAGVASARGLPDGRPRRRRGRTPGTAAAASHRRGPLPRHAPGGRRTAPSRGATPALLVFTRRPGGGSAPAAARTPSFGPHAAGKGDGGRDVRGPGRDRRRPRRAPSGRPSPQGGDTRRAAPPPLGTGSPALAGLRRRRARRTLAPGRAGDRAGRGTTAGGRRRRCVRGGRPSRGEGPDARDAAPRARETAAAGRGESAADPGGRDPAAEERQRAGALCRRRPLRRGERVGPRGRPRKPRPLRRGRAAERGGQGAPPRRGAVTPARARAAGTTTTTTTTTRSAAGGRGHHRRGSAGVAAPHPSVAPHRRPATPAAAAAAAAAGTAAATAGRAEPPESLNRRPARRPPFGPRSGVWRRRGGNLGGGGEPPRRGALGTWPWGEGNDLHGPAGVPPPLPPSGERPPAGARPTSAATTAASFSGPGVSLSSPALRPRGPPRLGPPRRRGDAARPPSAPRPRARARPEARPGTPGGGLGPPVREGHRSARERELLPARQKPRSPVREGPEEPPPPSPEGAPATRSLAISTSAADGCHGRTAGRRSTGEAARGGTGAPPGGCRAPLPPGTRAAPRAHRGEPASGELGPPLSGAPARGTRRPAFGGAGRGGREARGRPRPRSPAGTDRRQTGARPAGRGAERANGAGVRATPRARPAGRPGNAAGAEPHR
ncbi:collagen alpha-1(I) chain-like [Ammospiza caudacuta]|uniref:collagen alpha-1(I) chain-like n=1 Tax=Ammospiza caudacuta TaxID=2857398 RepID=UPI002739FF64|nr:collagen alpha-1(I) chain-like [Ammospiza caudacuta]